MLAIVGALAMSLAGAPILPRLISPPPSGAGLPSEGRNLPGGFEAVFRLTVSPLGEVETCRIAMSSGFRDFERRVCDQLRHDQFAPAKDAGGRPVCGTLELPLDWSAEGVSMKPIDPDVDVTVAQMPSGAPVHPIAKLALVIDATGRVESCDVAESSGIKALDAVACNAVGAATIHPVKDKSGAPVTSVQSLEVGFAAYATPIFKKNPEYAGLGDPGPYFPDRAAREGVSGYTIISCTAQPDGALTGCAVLEEAPRGWDFGGVSLRMAAAKWLTVAPGPEQKVVLRIDFPKPNVPWAR